jgi:hypothetical protein
MSLLEEGSFRVAVELELSKIPDINESLRITIIQAVLSAYIKSERLGKIKSEEFPTELIKPDILIGLNPLQEACIIALANSCLTLDPKYSPTQENISIPFASSNLSELTPVIVRYLHQYHLEYFNEFINQAIQDVEAEINKLKDNPYKLKVEAEKEIYTVSITASYDSNIPQIGFEEAGKIIFLRLERKLNQLKIFLTNPLSNLNKAHCFTSINFLETLPYRVKLWHVQNHNQTWFDLVFWAIEDQYIIDEQNKISRVLASAQIES